MTISKEDRGAYEKGRENYERGVSGALIDGFGLNLGRATDYGYTGSQLEAYQKGLSGKQLDKD